MSTSRIRVGVVFGGRSGEHEVSLRSAKSVIDAMDRSRYDIVPIAITKAGRWLASSDATQLLPQAVVESGDTDVTIVGDPTRGELVRLDASSGPDSLGQLDVIFPVLHGTYGEDGTIQGLLELAGLPYVGSGVLGSAAGMDKIAMKMLFRDAGLPIVPFVHFTRTQWEADRETVLDLVDRELTYPTFAKPANLGSSVGITKATDRTSLVAAIDEAARFDRRIVVEQGVDAREIEVAVLGNEAPSASVPGEIIPHADFYDYNTKYVNEVAEYAIPAALDTEQSELIRDLAVRAFQAVDAAGLARVDFFVERNTGTVYVNEINTMPGFTKISMYPKLWEATGLAYGPLIDRLIELAFDRHRETSRSERSVG